MNIGHEVVSFRTPKYRTWSGTATVRHWPQSVFLGIVTAMSYWKDRIVLVTGGSSGLGRVIANGFAAAGARIVITARNADAVQKAATELRTNGSDALGIQADITQQSDVDRLFSEAMARYGKLDALVNNAGRSARGNVLDTTPEQFRELMDLNLIALVRCTRAAAPHLLVSRGHVVNIGSLAAKSASRWVGAYPATKHAVAAYSQQLRLELGPQGLHVLLVCPGPIERTDARVVPLEGLENVPERARQPGAGVQTKAIPPQWLAAQIMRACERRSPEIVVPGYARLVFAVAQLWPSLGDWIVLKKT
jgi:NAD(P)-dependent dehydrogenase (short-subunit alcohol dehydrogenase family)